MPEGQGSEGAGTSTGAGNAGTTGAGEGGNTGAGGTGTGVNPANPPAGQGAGEADKTKTFSEEYVKELRAEAAKHRTKASAAEEELKQLKQQGMTDAEKLAVRLKELEDDNRNLAHKQRSAEIKAQGAALGCKKPDVLVKLIDDGVSDDDIAKELATIKKTYPELFLNSTGSGDGGAGAGGAGNAAGKSVGENMNFLIRQAAGRG